jgi:fructose-bisphosphate aldolase class II
MSNSHKCVLNELVEGKLSRPGNTTLEEGKTMALAQPAEMFRHAVENKYAIPAYNAFGFENIIATLDAAEAQRSPVIVLVSELAVSQVKYLDEFVKLIKGYASRCSVPVFVQYDHGASLQDCVKAIDAGVDAVMFDGSRLGNEENTRRTREVADYAHARGIWVEAEFGHPPEFSDVNFGQTGEFTDPSLVAQFISDSGCDALAISIGTAHGGCLVETAGDYLTMRHDLMRQIVAAAPDFPFVLHGTSSLSPELIAACNEVGGKLPPLRSCSEADVRTAVGIGLRKCNIDVDSHIPMITAIRRFLLEHPEQYAIPAYMASGRQAFQKQVEHKMKNVVNSADRY